MFVQYGKLSTSLIMQKKTFFEENNKHILKQREISDIYTKQEKRLNCKNCGLPLENNYDFVKDNIGYKICQTCTHLNGAFEDSAEYCQIVYADDGGKAYAENYSSKSLENYQYRVTSIYIPKAEFLYTSLKNQNVSPSKLIYLDFGAGTGYFVSALDSMGLQNIFGTEVAKNQVELGNKMIGKELLSVHDLEDTANFLRSTNANVISFIGVLEHLQDPREAIKATKENDKIEYLYISLPLFSLSVYIEMLSDEVFHRQLHGGHTHLYTEDSIKHLAEEFGYEIVSEWWFGTDIVDLYRNIFVNLEEKNTSKFLKQHYQNMMQDLIDAMQLEIDKKKYSSEVHMLLKKVKK